MLPIKVSNHPDGYSFHWKLRVLCVCLCFKLWTKKMASKYIYAES